MEKFTFSITPYGMVEFHHEGRAYLVGPWASAIAAAKAELPECLYRVSPEVLRRHLPPEAAALATHILAADAGDYQIIWDQIPDKTALIEDAVGTQGPDMFLCLGEPEMVCLDQFPVYLWEILVRVLDGDFQRLYVFVVE